MKKNICYIVICSVLCLVFSFSNNGFAQQKFAKEANSKKPAPLKNVKAATIIIQPFQGIPKSQVKYVYDKLKTYIPHVVLNKPMPLPKRAYYKPRNRYKADTLNLILKEKTNSGYVTIGLTNKDISTADGKNPDWGIMGLAYLPGKACTVSTFRLSKKNINEQYFKVAIHELGHTQGLYHCPNKTCLMTAAEGKNNTDKETGFCIKCKTFLINKGWKL